MPSQQTTPAFRLARAQMLLDVGFEEANLALQAVVNPRLRHAQGDGWERLWLPIEEKIPGAIGGRE